MPNLQLGQLVPTAFDHWTSILHYLVLLGSLYMLVTSGDKTPISFILILGLQAILIGASLYIDKVVIVPILLFLVRVGMVAIPTVLAGWAPTENSRSVGVTLALLAAPVLVMTFLSCNLGAPLADPRVFNLGWCG